MTTTRKPRSFYLRTGDYVLQFATTRERQRFIDDLGGAVLTASDARSLGNARYGKGDPELTRRYNERGYFVLNVWSIS